MISSEANDSGEINSSIPSTLISTPFFSINSVLDILAIVFLAPNCLARKHEVKLTDCISVTAINKSAEDTSASFKIDTEEQSP